MIFKHRLRPDNRAARHALTPFAFALTLMLGSLYGFAPRLASPAMAASDTEISEEARQRLEALKIGDMRPWWIREKSRGTTNKPFVNARGREYRLADFEGQVVLLTFWATWCPPCISEMPSLDRLAAVMEASPLADDFELLAVDLDPHVERAKKFYVDAGIKSLAFYHDESSEFSFEMMDGDQAIPTSFLIDRKGRVIARFLGDAEWDSAEAIAFIEAAVEVLTPPGG